jgi:hypothetical protein
MLHETSDFGEFIYLHINHLSYNALRYFGDSAIERQEDFDLNGGWYPQAFRLSAPAE